ncbi:putative dihydroxyacetone phosphate acyltransferase [Trypanosoma rangeli]|uniref:Putative dihydroxyacetone phosphate acyltransferase n=1 Tax=Trypanosoma rangeli TaxID=5698 RepID=A0A422NGQ1_TRYRA|nr:putative dihydroxyacetone phosphate acyltransferase [Trypanosoma rangeli]RNF04638.1 putative dihydroxyacetone phosphate acyltransferase [Trypanosoma rangeli]|eukprot:RNF04638.1 putative dihydroxyacetone phosphate acyltransferase [Trypanosoma rangeli]
MALSDFTGITQRWKFKRIVIVASDGVCWLSAASAISLAASPFFRPATPSDTMSIVVVSRFGVPGFTLRADKCQGNSDCRSLAFAAFESLCRDLPNGAELMTRVAFAVDTTRIAGAQCFTPDVKNDLYVYFSAWSDADCCGHTPLVSLASIRTCGGYLIILSDDVTRRSAWGTAVMHLPGWRLIGCFVSSFAPPSIDLHLTRSFVRQCPAIKGLLECVALGVAMGTVKHLPVSFRDPIHVAPLDVMLITALAAVLFQDDRELSFFSSDAVMLNVECATNEALVWGMAAEYIIDYYGRLGPAVMRSFPFPQLLDTQPTLQLSANITDWVNYGVSLMMPCQRYYTYLEAQHRKRLLNKFSDSGTIKCVRTALDNIDTAVQCITAMTTARMTVPHSKDTSGAAKPPTSTCTAPNTRYYQMLLQRVTQDTSLRHLLPFISLKNVQWDLYVKVVAQAVVERVACQIFQCPSDLPFPVPLYHNDIVFHGTRRVPSTSLSPRKWFSEIHWLVRCGMNPDGKRFAASPMLTKESMSHILTRPSVLRSIEEEAAKEKSSNVAVHRRAAVILRTVGDNLNQWQLRVFGLLVRRVLFRLYEEVSLNAEAFERLHKVLKTPRVEVVLLPAHRSYLDFIIMTYLLVVMGFSPPHVCAGDDFLRMGPITKLMRGSGAFFMRRSFRDDRLYYTLFREYLRQLVLQRRVVEFFIEGTRSRTGKTLCPKLGILRFITDTFFEVQDEVDDIYFLPISLSYDELLETRLFAGEQFGVSKPRENISNLLRARSLLNTRHGKIHVHIGEAFSLRHFRDQPYQCPIPFEPRGEIVEMPQRRTTHPTPPQVLLNLAWHVTHSIEENTVVTPTALVAMVLNVFAPTAEGMPLAEVHARMTWLRTNIVKRKGALSDDCTNCDVEEITRKGVTHLRDFVEVLDNGTKRIVVRQDVVSFMGLTICSNQLVHVFLDEAVVAVAARMYGTFNGVENTVSVELQQLQDGSQQLRQLLSSEFHDYLPFCPYTFVSWFEHGLARLLSCCESNSECDPSLSLSGTIDCGQKNNNSDLSMRTTNAVVISVTRLFRLLIAILSPFLEAIFFVSLGVCAVVESGSESVVHKSSLLKACQTCILKLHEAKNVVHPQSGSNDMLKNALEGIALLYNVQLDADAKKAVYVIPATTDRAVLLTRLQQLMQHVCGMHSTSPDMLKKEVQKTAQRGLLKEYLRQLAVSSQSSKM